MLRRALWLRAARILPASVLGAAVALVGGPAAVAADPPPSLSVVSPSSVTIGADPAPGKALTLLVTAHAAENPTIVFDESRLAGVATVELPDGCTTAGTTATCTSGIPSEGDGTLVVVIHPAPGAAVRAEGSLSVTYGADNVSNERLDVEVTVSTGVDIVVTSRTPGTRARTGDVVHLPVEFVNVGDQTADGITITLFFEHSVAPANYSNCGYGEQDHLHVAVCTFPDILAPGQGFAVAGGGFEGQVTPDAAPDVQLVALVGSTASGSALPKAVKPHARPGGRRLTLTPVVRPNLKFPSLDDIDASDNYTALRVTVTNAHRDVAAVGATATGTVGDTVTVNIGAKNLGPAVVDTTRGGQPALFWTFIPPPGTTVVAVPQLCQSVTAGDPIPGGTGGSFYRCGGADFVGAGAASLQPVTLRITQVVPDAKGTVSLDDPRRDQPLVFEDDNAANNTVDLVLNPTGTGGSGGGLPVTGTRTDLFVGGGVVLLAAGVGLAVLGRRRRTI